MRFDPHSTVVVNAIRVDKSIVACSRIARFLRKKFGFAVVDSADVKLAMSRYDDVILINSPWGFCDAEHRERVGSIIAAARRVTWVQNDYNGGIGPRSLKQLSHEWLNKGRPIGLWTTVPHFLEKWKTNAKIPLDQKRSGYVNWNALHYEPAKPVLEKRRALLYYGAFRPGRAAKFEAYLADSSFDLVLSTSKVYGARAFRPLLERRSGGTQMVGPLADPIGELSKYAATLYLEDEFALENFVSPAGRFYEGLAARTFQFVDVDAARTLSKAGYAVPTSWAVSDARAVDDWLRKKTVNDFFNAAVEQRNVWARTDPRAAFYRQLRKVMAS